VKDAIRDGLRSIKNVFDDQSVIPGAVAFEISCQSFLIDNVREHVEGKAILGVKAFAEALLTIP
jgi:T-complex protein 1 subunit zeta